jgi:hypothetical protein
LCASESADKSSFGLSESLAAASPASVAHGFTGPVNAGSAANAAHAAVTPNVKAAPRSVVRHSEANEKALAPVAEIV